MPELHVEDIVPVCLYHELRTCARTHMHQILEGQILCLYTPETLLNMLYLRAEIFTSSDAGETAGQSQIC